LRITSRKRERREKKKRDGVQFTTTYYADRERDSERGFNEGKRGKWIDRPAFLQKEKKRRGASLLIHNLEKEKQASLFGGKEEKKKKSQIPLMRPEKKKREGKLRTFPWRETNPGFTWISRGKKALESRMPRAAGRERGRELAAPREENKGSKKKIRRKGMSAYPSSFRPTT